LGLLSDVTKFRNHDNNNPLFDLITSPAYVVIKAANEFKDKTTAIKQL
jgi:hypothetical protein